MAHFFKTLSMAAALAAIAGLSQAATIYDRTETGNDPFPGSLDGSPSLVKCDMESEGNIGVECDLWEDGASAGTYVRGAPDATGLYPASAFGLVYSSINAFSWSFVPTDVTGEALFVTKISVKTGGPGGGAYLVYDVTRGDTSGMVDIAADLGSPTFAISHVSFYDTGLTPVPLPAAGWMLLAALGGLAALRRRACRDRGPTG